MSDYWNIKGLVILIVSLHGKISFAGLLGYQRVNLYSMIFVKLLGYQRVNLYSMISFVRLLGYQSVLVIVSLHGKISFAGLLGYQRVSYQG